MTETKKNIDPAPISQSGKEGAKNDKLQPHEPKNRSGVDALIETIGSLSVTELANLVAALKEKFQITAAAFAPAAVASAQGAQAGAQVPAEEVKSDYIVSLVSVGDKKIQVLKELRALTNLGLKEAKDVIDKTPSVIKEEATKEEADKIKTKLEEVGAKVEIK